MATINNSIAAFTWDTFKQLNKSKSDGNIFFSPFGITCSLGIVLLGSKGDTAQQIEKVLHVQTHETSPEKEHEAVCKQPGDQYTVPETGKGMVEGDIHNQLKALSSKLKSSGDTELKIANGLFTNLNFTISKNFLASAQMFYQANLKSVDFGQDKAREDINKWVETETNGKIKDLVAPNSLSKDTAMMVLNAMYFKGKWSKMFKTDDTKDSPFYVKETSKITVPMMSQTETFNHAFAEELDAQVLELQYTNANFSMYIILPNKIAGLQKITDEKKNLELLAKWTDSKNLKATKVEVHLPRFKIEESYDLTLPLQNLGMTDVFSQQKANLSGISDVGLYVSKVFHKTYIEVNEEGTEAAGATGAVIVPKSLKPPIQFKVDHPCVCVIKHNITNTILFCLKLNSPNP